MSKGAFHSGPKGPSWAHPPGRSSRNLAGQFGEEQLARLHARFDGRIARLHYPPSWVTVGVTGSCSFQCEYCCIHCPASGENERTAHQYKMSYNMRLEDFRRIADMCHQGGVRSVHVCAPGEPFLHPKILDIIDYTIDTFGHASLQTDFWQTIYEKRGYVEEIIARKDHIDYITTDIFPAAVHESIKRGSSFDYLLDCMERISKSTSIPFGVHVLLSKGSYHGIAELLRLLHSRRINFYMDIVHLFPFGFNQFTSMDNVYTAADTEITQELDKVRAMARELGVRVQTPKPWEQENALGERCKVFWEKVQLVPSKKVPKQRWIGSAIPQQCSAVVLGDIFSVGNLFDYESFMDFWNNDYLVGIRRRIMRGELPDPACRVCPIGDPGAFKPVTVLDKLKTAMPAVAYYRMKALLGR